MGVLGAVGGAVKGAVAGVASVPIAAAQTLVSRSVVLTAAGNITGGIISGAKRGFRGGREGDTRGEIGTDTAPRGIGSSQVLAALQEIVQEQVITNDILEGVHGSLTKIRQELISTRVQQKQQSTAQETVAQNRQIELLNALEALGTGKEKKGGFLAGLFDWVKKGFGVVFDALKNVGGWLKDALAGLAPFIASTLGKVAGPLFATALAGLAAFVGYEIGKFLNEKFNLSEKINEFIGHPGDAAANRIRDESVADAHARELSEQAKADLGFDPDLKESDMTPEQLKNYDRRLGYLAREHIKMRKARRVGPTDPTLPTESPSQANMSVTKVDSPQTTVQGDTNTKHETNMTIISDASASPNKAPGVGKK